MNINGNLSAQNRVVLNLQNTTPKAKVVNQDAVNTTQKANESTTLAANYGNATTEQYLANMGINLVSVNKAQPAVVDAKLVDEVANAAVQVLNELNAGRANTLDDVKKATIVQGSQVVQTKGFFDFFKKIGNAVVDFLKQPGPQKFINWIDVGLDYVGGVIPGGGLIHRVVRWMNGLA